jgi:hypothetical protein
VSNPAFLGIHMYDGGGRGPCMIESATRNGPAEAAGLRNGDLVVAIDDKPIGNCSALLAEITSHVPGDAVQIKLSRGSSSMMVRVQLTTRDALLRKVLGMPMVQTNLIGVDGGTVYDLSALHGRPAIIGLYDPGCVDCGSLFTRFLSWARLQARRGGPQVLVLAVVPSQAVRDLALLQRSLEVPVAAGSLVTEGQNVDVSPFSREAVLFDRERLGVILIDGRGTVQYLGPIAPNSDDTEAMLDELFVAAEQAVRRSR